MSSSSGLEQCLAFLDAGMTGWSPLGAFCREEDCTVAGLPVSALAFLLAWHRRGAPPDSLLVVLPDIRTQEELANDLDAWGCSHLFLPELTEKEDGLSDPDLEAELRTVLLALRDEKSPLVLATVAGLERKLPSPDGLVSALLKIKKGDKLPPAELVERLVTAGYVEEKIVVQRGQFARRGGIMDVFSRQALRPVRMEWFGNELDSLREFDPAEQQSVGACEAASILLDGDADESEMVTLKKCFAVSPHVLRWEEQGGGMEGLGAFYEHAFLRQMPHDPVLQENRRRLIVGHLEDWIGDGWNVWLSCNNEGEEQRLREWLDDSLAPDMREELKKGKTGVRFVISPLLRGFSWPEGRLVVLPDAEMFGRYQTLRSRRRLDRLQSLRGKRQAVDYGEIEEGDYVVHVEHGVGLFIGMRDLPGSDEGKEAKVMEIEFAGQARLYVPVEQAWLVSRYVGVGKANPPLDTLGGTRWTKAKAQAEKAIMDYAARLLRLQAERETLEGCSFPPDTPWQKEFEGAFLYKETADQLKAIVDAKQDMESLQPMDRLICGDVGFGKTEVAIRAAFKAVMSGKQVAFLVPTTVLAQQHYLTLRERMADYPVQVEMLSRFVSKPKQNEVAKRLREGGVDIVVGTHRLISKDIQFANLGLVIIDEEQRFGVHHKERFKEKFRLIDVLTLSATPIPRTLYMALMGARDMSTIETPPVNRLPVETSIQAYDERLIRSAVERELRRGGQVFFLHNRVHSIDMMAEKIRFLVPDARVDVGHGQMDEHQLEDVMQRFVDGKTDVLVSTTIIESGIDIPNANTIIIDRADRFGLADLYQLRGRVGRAQNRAYAILLLPRDLMGGDAGKRVQAIKQYSQLGSGFKIAMRDLEIRGAGNLLGTAQSGHITAIGFDLYCRLLKRAVASLKGDVRPADREVQFRLDFMSVGSLGEVGTEEARIPESYITETAWRIAAYRELAELPGVEEWTVLRTRWKDRFGKWPDSVELLLIFHRVKLNAQMTGFSRIEVREGKLMMTRRGDFVMVGGKFPRLTTSAAKSKLLEIEKWVKSFRERS